MAPDRSHYRDDQYEPIRVGRANGWGYELTAVYKYCQRSGKKTNEDAAEPIRKAIYLLERHLAHLEGRE